MPLRSTNLIPLVGGAYSARSKVANYQICENLFPEINPQDSEPDVPVTHYPREGKRPLSVCPAPGPGRGIFTMSNGALYAAVAQTLYSISPDWVWTQVGQIGDLKTPVSMSDNGTTAVLVDGSPNGYQVPLAAGGVFGPIMDPTGTFVGSRRVDFSDTYMAFAAPGTNGWYISLSNQVAFNALVQANKDSSPDPIQTLAFNIRQAWLFGTESTEVWYLAGSSPFAYQEWPNVFIPYGCVAPYSVVQADVDLFWMSQNKQGQAIALKSNGYAAVAISTRALESEWTSYPTVADVIGGTFQQAGHTFIVLHFPTADKTWAYDLSTKQWHRRTFVDQNGRSHRESAAFYAAVGPAGGFDSTNVAQDWRTGQLYALDPNYYTDNGMPIVFRRTFPHEVKDLHFVTDTEFVADFETGNIAGIKATMAKDSAWSTAFSAAFGNNVPVVDNYPTLFMRYSTDGGATFGNYRGKQRIASGQYRSMMRWRGLGMARDRVYELMWAYPGPSALQGAYVGQIEHSS